MMALFNRGYSGGDWKRLNLFATLLFMAALAHGDEVGTHPFVGGPGTLTAGSLLVAADTLLDPVFHHAVILILVHGKKGTLGLIVNRTDRVSSRHVFPDLPITPGKNKLLYYGGPVGRKQLSLLVRTHCPHRIDGCVLDDVYFTTRPPVVKALLQKNCGDKPCRLYTGFASWSPGQLEQELATDSWLVVTGNPESVFSMDLNKLWQHLFTSHHGTWAYGRAGPVIMAMAQRKIH